MTNGCPAGFTPADVAPPPLPDRLFPIRSLALDLSGRCNLACRYCVETATQPPRSAMTAEMLERVWEWFCRSRTGPSWTVRVGSGEPLLALPLLRRLDDLMRAETGRSNEGRAFITTNATLLDEQAAGFLAASGWDIKVSLDGPEDTHDRWRVTPTGGGTHRRVAAAVEALVKRLHRRVTVGSVLCHDSDPARMAAAARDVGAWRIEFFPVVTDADEARLDSSDHSRYREFIFDCARRLAAGERVVPGVGRFERAVAGVMGYGNRRVRCPAARGYVGVGPDGGLYPCMRLVGIEDHRIGDVASGIDPEATLAFQRGAGRTYDRRTDCGECWAAPLCGGPCFASAAMFDVREHCELYRSEASAAIWLVQQLRERDPARLLAFLDLRQRTSEPDGSPGPR